MTKRKRKISLSIDELAAGGDGLGRDEEGRVTFVPQSAPGDRVLVELVDERKQFARGKIVEILEPSPERQEPVCKIFKDGLCGGCQWQHLTPEAQRAAKEGIVNNGLRQAIGRGLSPAPLQEPCQALGWRRRARLSFWAGGPILLGFFPPKSKRITDIESCPQLELKLQEALQLVRKHLLPALRHRGEVELLLAADNRCHVVVSGTVAPQGLKDLAAEPEIAGVINGKTTLGEAQVSLEEGVSAAANQFAQASRAGNAALCAAVAGTLGDLEGTSVLELFSGGGNLTRLLSGAKRVVAVEAEDWAVETPENVSWRVGDVDEEIQRLVAANERFDTVLLDPPRAGAREAMAGIASLEPSKIVYVSCDVATLGRDTEALHELGYTIVSATPIDLMPQTAHVEVVAVFERA